MAGRALRPPTPARRAWELRHTARGWDATYVALAEALGAVLITADGRLAAAVSPTCSIELIGR